MNTILQVPMSKELRDQARSKAQNMGFSSLQETVRVFLGQLASNEVTIAFEPPAVKLSKKNEERYSKMMTEVKSGKNVSKAFTNVKSMMKYLNED